LADAAARGGDQVKSLLAALVTDRGQSIGLVGLDRGVMRWESEDAELARDAEAFVPTNRIPESGGNPAAWAIRKLAEFFPGQSVVCGDSAAPPGGYHGAGGGPPPPIPDTGDAMEGAEPTEPGFTGEIVDKLGRRYLFRDGRRVKRERYSPNGPELTSVVGHAWVSGKPIEVLSHDPNSNRAKVRFTQDGKTKVIDAGDIDFVTVEEWNGKFHEFADATGLEAFDAMDKVQGGNREEQVEWMTREIEARRGGPKAWEKPSAFDPGEFSTGDWEPPEKAENRRQWWAAAHAARNKFRDFLSAAREVPNEQKARYLETCEKVMEWMPRSAIETWTKNVAGARFWKSVRDMNRDLATPPGKVVGGAWEYQRGASGGKFLLDGDSIGQSHNGLVSREIYAHEFGHACDQYAVPAEVQEVWGLAVPKEEAEAKLKQRIADLHLSDRREVVEMAEIAHRLDREGKDYFDRLGVRTDDVFKTIGRTHVGGGVHLRSDSARWRDAYKAELADKQLSDYASTSPSEGFAEFARLCWGTGTRPREIAEDFPKCWAVFEAVGLVEPLRPGGAET